MYTITLADGTKLKELELNGNNYISPNIIEDSVFEGNLGSITTSDGKNTEAYKDMALIQNTTYDGVRSWFILAPKSARDRKSEKRESEITTLQIALTEIYEQMLGGV